MLRQSLFSFVLSATILQANCQCGPDYLGNKECVKFSMYDKAQYSTCLTEDYIQQYITDKFGIDSHCRNGGPICYLQCEAEAHANFEGLVSDECSCEVGAEIEQNDLDPSCYSPSGDSCDWYNDCLEEKYPCRGSKYDYATQYANKFCNRYTDAVDEFSSNGRQWVNEVRKCLQVSLVPILRNFNQQISCETIQQTAFDSHSSCYANPVDGGEKFCSSLTCGDYFNVLKVIGPAFKSTPYESLVGVLKLAGWECFLKGNTFDGCAPLHFLTEAVSNIPVIRRPLALTRFIINILDSDRRRENVENKPAIVLNSTLSILDQISSNLVLPEGSEFQYEVLQVIPTNSSDDARVFYHVEILLFNPNDFTAENIDASYSSNDIVSINEVANETFSTIMSSFRNVISSNTYHSNEDGLEIIFQEVSECGDGSCEVAASTTVVGSSIETTVESSTEPSDTGPSTTMIVGIAVGAVIGVILIVALVIFIFKSRDNSAIFV